MSRLFISKYIKKEYIKFLESKDKKSSIKELWELIHNDKVIEDADKFLKQLLKREKVMSTGIGAGIAIPHVKMKEIKDFVFGIGISRKGINFDSIDNKPVHIIIMIAAPEHKHDEYLRLLSKVVLVLKDKDLRHKIIHSKSIDEINDILMKK